MEIFQVDAFTIDSPFSGNPAAICMLPGPGDEGAGLISADWMQALATEMNLSETAFVAPARDGFTLRWFTPCIEVDLCGHATLAVAHVLWETGRLGANDEARFHTKSGLLRAVKKDGLIEIVLPTDPPEELPATEVLAGDLTRNLREALGLTSVKGLGGKGLGTASGKGIEYVGKARFDLLVLLGSEEELQGLVPDFALLRKLPARGVIVTAPSDDKGNEEGKGDSKESPPDFVSRFFAPSVGIDEDPVTGSAHCALGPFWAKRLGKSVLVAHQLSARGGRLFIRVGGVGDEVKTVTLGGMARTVFSGRLTEAFHPPLDPAPDTAPDTSHDTSGVGG